MCVISHLPPMRAQDERPARRRAAGNLECDQRQVAARLHRHVLRHEVRRLSVRTFDVTAEHRGDLLASVRALRLREREERGRVLGERADDAVPIERVQRGHETRHRRTHVRFVVRASGGAAGQQEQNQQRALHRAATSRAM